MLEYQKFRAIMTREDYFGTWDQENLDLISEKIKDKLYTKYVLKCVVFTRDRYECKNLDCEYPGSALTLHHIKWQKNGGQDKPKNCITICKTCHQAFHRGKSSLTFNGMTYKIDLTISVRINLKEIKKLTKSVRKKHKDSYNVRINWDIVLLLMKFLSVPYEEMVYDD